MNYENRVDLGFEGFEDCIICVVSERIKIIGGGRGGM